MRQTELWIGGKFVAPSSGEYFDDINPSDQKAFARVAKGTSADIGIAVRAAKDAYQVYKDSQAKQREKILCDAASIVERDREDYLY